jgi:hypothetical protein
MIRAVRGGQLLLADHLLILQPSQASFWTIGENMPISWEPADITGNVIISLSRDGGKEGTFETIAENQNNGTFNWQVTGDISVNCVMKIVPINAPDKGTQQGLFTIQTDSGYQFQNVILSPDTPTVSHTSSFTITAIYSTSNHTQTKGIGVRFHYDSSIFQFTGYENVCLSPTINDPTPKFDTDNADNDSSTDLYVVLSWASLAQDWPAVALPVKLADLKFTAIDTGQGNVNVSFLDTSDNYTGKAGNAIITSTIATDLKIQFITQRTDGSGFLDIVFIGTASQSITGSWLSDACNYSLAPDYSTYTPVIFKTSDPAHNANSGLTFSPEAKRYTAVVNASEWLSGNYKIQLAFTNEMAAMAEEISIDNTSPEMPIILTNEGKNIATIENILQLTGTCSLDTEYILINDTIQGIAYTKGSAEWSYTGEIQTGDNIIVVESLDSLGNHSNPYTLTVKYIPPFKPFTCPVPDSGQTVCSDNNGTQITCTAPGAAYYGQDGSYRINEMSFTKLDEFGNDLPVDAPNWVMVRDNVTGLIWEIKQAYDGVADYDNPNDTDNTYTWYKTTPGEDALIAYFPFDENANDTTGNGYDGIVYGNMVYEAGVVNQAAIFDGIDDYIQLSKTLDTNEIKAISVYINSKGTDGNNNNGVILGKYDWEEKRNFVIKSYGLSSDRLNYIGATFHNDPGGGAADVIASYINDISMVNTEKYLIINNQQLTINTWKHIVVNMTATIIEIWIDGQITNKVNRDYDIYNNDNAETFIGNLLASGEGSNNRFIGAMDDLRIFNRPLTEPEIQALYQKRIFPGEFNDGKNTESYIHQLNEKRFGGFNDWRLPSAHELSSFPNCGKEYPAVETDYFQDIVADMYWTDTNLSSTVTYAWVVHFDHGWCDYKSKGSLYHVRAVRGRQNLLSDHFVNNGDETVTDIATGLMWQLETPDTKQNWGNALASCENLSLAQFNDWRLPAPKEIRSIIDFRYFQPAIDSKYFPDTMSEPYCTSASSIKHDYQRPWLMGTSSGSDTNSMKTTANYYRAVRGGQNRLTDHLFIISPKQGSIWKPGDIMSIVWETNSISGNVSLSLSREGGRDNSFENIIETENDGYYEWTVSGNISVNCMLKIEPLAEPDKSTQQGLFSIYPDSIEKYQHVRLHSSTMTAELNKPITITANYSTSDIAKTTGVGLRFHYDSSKLMFMGFHSVSLTPSAIGQTSLDDMADDDNDPSTDKYVILNWSSPKMDWPEHVMALKLAELNFTTQSFGPGNINISFLELSNGYIGKAENVSIIVEQPANTQPIISLIEDQTIDEDTTGFISFTVTDAESDPCDLTLNITSSDQSILPDNSISYVCSENNYTITALPEMNQNGIVELSLMVSDHEGLTASTSVQLTITSVDDPPTITEISNLSIELNKACTLSFTITDADSTDLTVSATSSNQTLVAINTIVLTGQGSVRSISITPTEHMSGSSIITLAVTDGNITITSSFELTVIPNYHPEIPTLSEPENNQKEVAQQPLLSWTCSDPNQDDILTYDVYLSTSESLTTCIASGLTQTQLQLTHNLDLYQNYYWKVIVTDQYGATQSSPVWSFKTDDQPDIFFDQDLSPYTVNDCPRIDFPKSLAAQNNMLKNMINLKMVDFENFDEGSITSLSLDFGKGGNATINFATGLIVIVENPNETLDGMFPVSGTKFLESKSTVNIVFEKEMSAFGFYVTDFEHNSTDVIFTHASGDKQTFQIPYTLQNSGSVSFWGIIFKAFTFQNITIKGSDDNDFLGFDDFIAIEKSQLSSENLPPEVPSQNTPENNTENIELTPTLTWSCTDPNPLDTLTYTLYLNTSNSFSTPLTSNLSQMSYTVQSPLLTNTTYYWRVDASDQKGLITQGPTWEFKTILVNTRPMISLITDQSMYEDTTSAISFTVTDAESDPCDLSIIIKSSDQYILSDTHISYSCDANNYIIAASPEINQSGTIVLTVLVSDQYDLTASTSFPLTVLAVNDPPAISDIENQSIKLNSTTAFSYTITDVDSANFNVSATSSNLTLVSIENMVLNDSGMISITPTENMSGIAIITLAVSDGELTVTTDFELTVIPNYPPDTPSSPLPANDAYAISQYPQLSWQCSDQNPEDVLTFDVYVSQSQSLTETLATGLTQTTFLITNPLSFHTRYYWRIDVTDQYGAKQTGQVWTFLTVPALNDGLSAYYPFDQDAKDHSGNGNHCSVHGPQPMMDHTMSADSAYYFDGSNDYIQCPNTSTFSVGSAVSYIFWLKYQKNGFVYNKWSYGAEDKWIYGNLNFYFYQKSNVKPSEPVPVDTWLHVAIVYQSSRAYFYYNGEFISSSSMGSGSLKNSSGTPYFGSNPGRTVGSAGKAPYKGGLDEFRIYNRALSQEEIWSLYTENSGYVTVSSDTMHLTGNAGAFELTIDNTGQTPVNWSILSNVSWMTIDPPSSGTNKGSVTVTYSAIDQQKRTGTLTILSDDAMNTPYTIVVNQQEDNVAPYTPSNLNPGDGSENQPVDLTLSWTGGDANIYDTTYYDLYLSLNDPPILYASDLTVTHYVITDLLYEQDYFWKIVAKDTYDLQAQSPVCTFRTGARSIHMNVTLSPENSGIIQINGTDVTVPYTQTFDPGTSITIAAIPSDSYSFIYWQGNIDQINTSYQVITAEHNLDITAIFNHPPDKPEITSISVDNVSVTITTDSFMDADASDSHLHTVIKLWREDQYIEDQYVINPIEIEMSASTSTLIPESNLQTNLKYRYQVGYQDTGSKMISWSDEASFITGHSEPKMSQVLPGDEITEYKMVSFTQWPSNPYATNLFAHLGVYEDDFRMGTYEPEIANYIEYSDELMIQPGRAYWLLVKKGCDLALNAVSVSMDADIDVALKFNPDNPDDGWNMIACPNDASYHWGNIQILQYDENGNVKLPPVSISNMRNIGLIEDGLWQWEKNETVPYSYHTWLNFELVPGEGYWVKALEPNVFLRFPKNNRTRSIRKKNNTERQSQYEQDDPPMPMSDSIFEVYESAPGGCFIEKIFDGFGVLDLLFFLGLLVIVITCHISIRKPNS